MYTRPSTTVALVAATMAFLAASVAAEIPADYKNYPDVKESPVECKYRTWQNECFKLCYYGNILPQAGATEVNMQRNVCWANTQAELKCECGGYDMWAVVLERVKKMEGEMLPAGGEHTAIDAKIKFDITKHVRGAGTPAPDAVEKDAGTIADGESYDAKDVKPADDDKPEDDEYDGGDDKNDDDDKYDGGDDDKNDDDKYDGDDDKDDKYSGDDDKDDDKDDKYNGDDDKDDENKDDKYNGDDDKDDEKDDKYNGGSCKNGELKCDGKKVLKCDHKRWATIVCPGKSRCEGSGKSFYCSDEKSSYKGN